MPGDQINQILEFCIPALGEASPACCLLTACIASHQQLMLDYCCPVSAHFGGVLFSEPRASLALAGARPQ